MNDCKADNYFRKNFLTLDGWQDSEDDASEVKKGKVKALTLFLHTEPANRLSANSYRFLAVNLLHEKLHGRYLACF